MTFKKGFNPNSRTFYVSSDADASQDGFTPDTSLLTVQLAIDAVNALSPPPSSTNPASILLVGTGDLTESNLTIPTGVQFEGGNTFILPFTGPGFILGSFSNFNLLVTGVIGDGSTVFLADSISASFAHVDICNIIGNSNIGVNLTGSTSAFGVIMNRLAIVGEDNIGVLDDTTTDTSIQTIEVDQIGITGINNVGVRYNPSISTSKATLTSSGILTSATFSGTIGLDILNGILSSEVISIDAETAIHVASGAVLNLVSTEVDGDIIIDAGGILNCEILGHPTGTITNNGTINGRIGLQVFNIVAGAGGSDTEIQFNNSGTLDGISGVTTDSANLRILENSFLFLGDGVDTFMVDTGSDMRIQTNVGDLIVSVASLSDIVMALSGTQNTSNFTVTDGFSNPLFHVTAEGRVTIGSSSPDPSTILDLQTDAAGFLMPTLTTTQRDAISSPATGLEIFNTTTNEPEFFDGSIWLNTGGTAPGGINTEIQFNDNGSFNGISGITTDGINLLVSGRIDGDGPGGLLNITGADSATVAGGDVFVTGGNAGTVGKGGDIILKTGDASGSGEDSGAITIDAGTTVDGSVGDILMARATGKVGVGVSQVLSSAKLEINGLIQTDGMLSLDDVKIQAPTSGTVQFSITDDTTADQVTLIYNDATGNADLIALSNFTVSSVEGTLDLASASGVSGGDGGTLSVLAGSGEGTGAGGAVDIEAGSSGVTSGNGGDLTIRSGAGTSAGGAVNLKSGDGTFASGSLSINAGNVTGSGVAGTLTLLGGVSGGSSTGGQVHVFGGIGGDASGTGGQLLVHAGSGGNSDGDGGLLSLEGGQGFSSGNSDGGDVDIQGGQNFGTGVLGDVLLQKDEGNVGIGTNAPATILDIQSNSPAITVRNLADFGRAEISLYGSRNQGAGTATVAHINGFNTRSGSDIVTSRIAFANGASGTSAGSMQFLTREEADSGLTVRMVIDEAGQVIINGENASRINSITVEIFSAANLDDLATAGVITVANGEALSLNIMTSFTSATRFAMEGNGTLSIVGQSQDSNWTYSGTDTFISGNSGGVFISAMGLFSSSTGTFSSLSGSALNVSNSFIIGWDNLGDITNSTGLIVRFCTLIDCDSGWTIENANINFVTVLIIFAGLTGNVINFSGVVQDRTVVVSGLSVTLGGSNAFIEIDPAITADTKISINTTSLFGGAELFDISGGATGTFTNTFDGTIPLTTIDSVTDSSGVARFNFTVGPLPPLFVNQEMDISNFVTQTNYNQTGLITATGAGFFEISSIAFTADDATGDFSGNSIILFDDTTTLVDGDTLVLDTTGSTDYDGGFTVYGKGPNQVQVNRTFTFDFDGTWNTNGIDESDKRVLAFNNAGFIDSKYIATAFVNDNSEVNGTIVNDTFTDMVFGTGGSALVAGSTIERWKLIDEVNGTFEYTGIEPFSDAIQFDFTVTSTGGTVDFRFKWVVDTGSGFGDLTDNVEALIAVASTAQSVTKKFPLAVNIGDQIKPQITRNSGTSTIITSYATIFAGG